MGLFDNILGGTLYVRIYTDRIRIRRIETGEDIDLNATTPFSHPRSTIGSFKHALSLLQQGFRSIRKITQPVVIMHIMGDNEGGLTEIEERVLVEIARQAGAGRTIIWQGDELTSDEEIKQLAQTP